MAPSATHESPVDGGSHAESIVPLIDFSKFQSKTPEDTRQVADELFEAFKDSGFVYLQNHNLPQEVVDEAFAWVCSS
jgi:isopenicillin N synthase-like dioxygenase